MSPSVQFRATARSRAIARLQRHWPGLLALLRRIRLWRHPDSYLRSSGLYHSYRQGYPVDTSGRPLPWMNYPVIRLLDQRLAADLRVFEFGSGYSTLFLAERVAQVVSVEYDAAWHRRVSELVPDNVTLLHVDFEYDGDYCRSIGVQAGEFDLVIVDGRDRVRCAEQALASLSERGVILFDDSDRENYAESIRALAERGFRTLDFEGLKPLGHELHRSTLLYRPGNCLGI